MENKIQALSQFGSSQLLNKMRASLLAAAILFIPNAFAQTAAPATNPPAKSAAKPTPTKSAAPKVAPVKFDAAATLNKAIRQPMLAERITKSFSLIGQNVLETRSRRQLDDSLREFGVALKDLNAAAPTPEIKENYELLAQLFDEYRSIQTKPVNIDNARTKRGAGVDFAKGRDVDSNLHQVNAQRSDYHRR
jgi:hypothetical protein